MDLYNNPLPSANIFIRGIEKGVTSNSDGKFIFTNLPKGVFTLTCSHISFLPDVQIIKLETTSIAILIKLKTAAKSMEEIVLTSAGNEPIYNSTHTSNSVSHSELQKSGQNTLMESISQKPGMDIISTGGIGKPVIRGLSFNRIALYSMGTKIESQQWDDDHDAGIAEAGIERAEIVFGPSALVYGSDALGGAIIFIDEKNAAAGKTIGNVNLGLFSNTRGINVNAGLRHTFLSGIFYSAFINNQSHGDYRPGLVSGEKSSLFAINSRYNNFSSKAKLGISKKWGTAKLSYSFLRSLSGLVVDEAEDSISRVNGTPYVSNSRKMMAPYFDVTTQVLSSENVLLARASKWNVNVSYQSNKRNEFMPLPPGVSRHISLGLLLQTFNYDIKRSSNEEKNPGYTIGTQGTFQANRNYGTIIATPDAIVNDVALYGLMHYKTGLWNFQSGLRIDSRNINVAKATGAFEDETSLDSLEKVALNSLGLKRTVSNFRKHYYPFSFSSGLVYNPAMNIHLKTNIATGFSAPNFAELSTYWKHEGTLRFEIGNPDLKPQQNIEGDLSLTWELKPVSLFFSAFLNSIHNYIFLAPTSDTAYDLQVIAFTQKNASIYGGEFGLNLHPPGIKWVELNSSLSINVGRISGGTFLPYFPSNKIRSELKLEPDSIGKIKDLSISISMTHHFEQNHPALYETPTKGYSLWDVNIGCKLMLLKHPVHAVLFCTNLLNTAYYNHLSVLKVIGIYDRGRNVGIKLNFPLGR